MTTLNAEITLKNVIISYPHLFEKSGNIKFPESEPKYNATFMLHKEKNKGQIEQIKKIIDGIASLNKWKIKVDKIRFQDGEDSDKESLKDFYLLTAKSKNRPLVIDRSRNPITQSDDLIYSGCEVNALVQLYFSTVWSGITAELKAVQFVREGLPLGREPVNIERTFEILEINDLEAQFGF